MDFKLTDEQLELQAAARRYARAAAGDCARDREERTAPVP
jgi:hypothetical protein